MQTLNFPVLTAAAQTQISHNDHVKKAKRNNRKGILMMSSQQSFTRNHIQTPVHTKAATTKEKSLTVLEDFNK